MYIDKRHAMRAEARATLRYGIRKPETGIRDPESANKRQVLQIRKRYVILFSPFKMKRKIKNGFNLQLF